MLGDLVNVVSNFTHENAASFSAEIWKPAVKLTQLYAAQVSRGKNTHWPSCLWQLTVTKGQLICTLTHLQK